MRAGRRAVRPSTLSSHSISAPHIVSTGLKTQKPLQRIQLLAEDLSAAYTALLGGETVAAPAELRVLLGEWADTVTAVNERIAYCHALVRRGLRDDAIGSALKDPDLFEAVKALDLERFGRVTQARWGEAGKVAGLVEATTPHFEKMADIEAAREQLVELRPLLERWRRMNFQRAPLPDRIAMLRELAAREPDAACPVWRDMLVDHESHRLMEIKASLTRLRERFGRERDLDIAEVEKEVGAALEELRGTWTTLEPPADVAMTATRLIVDAQQRRVDATLDRLVTELEAAHAALAADRPAAKGLLGRLLDEWNQSLAARGVIDPADPRLARVAPIVTYATLVREHDALKAEVGQRLGERPTTLRARSEWAEALGRMMDRIDDSATRLPAEDVDPRQIRMLSDRVGDAGFEVRRESWLRTTLAIAAAVAVLVGVAAAAVGVYSVNRHRATVVAALAACDEALGKIEAGQAAVADPGDDWPAAVRRDAQVVAALDALKSARERHTDRVDSLSRLHEELQKALGELHAAGRPEPFEPWPEPFARATTLLAKLREPGVAITDEERARLEQPAATLRAKAKDLAAAADDAFEDQVRRLEARLAESDLVIRDNPVDASDKVGKAVDEADDELARLRRLAATAACPTAVEGYGGRKIVSDTAASRVSASSQVTTKLNALRSRVGVTRDLETRQAAADRLLMGEKYAEYADAIRAIAEDVGSGGGIGEYTAVARDHAEWQAVAGWHRFVTSVRGPASLTAEEARAALEKLRGLGPDVARLRDAQVARTWLEPALERAAASTAEKLDQLRSRFTMILESQHGEGIDGVAWELGTLPYPRYYLLLRDRPLPDDWTRFNYVVGRPDQSREWPKKQFFSSDPKAYGIADSPQKLLALRCKKAMENSLPPGAPIDRLAVSVVKTCSDTVKPSADQPAIDPCMQTILLRFVVLEACDASPTLKTMLANAQAKLNAGQAADGQTNVLKGVENEVFTTAALIPEKQNDGKWIQDQRKKCDDFVHGVFREANEAAQKIEAREKDLAQRFSSLASFRCVGRLRKRAEGGWEITGGDAAVLHSAQLFVAGGAAAHHEMVPCVTCNAEGKIPAGSSVAARAGDPVWIRITRDKKG